MNRFYLLFILASVCMQTRSIGNATLIVDAEDKTVLQLISSATSVDVVNQVATVTTTQEFFNDLNAMVHVKYAFPLYSDAAATSLRWYLNGSWHEAVFVAAPADSTMPGGDDIDPSLDTYLGETPLYFDLSDSVYADSTIIFELTYVQLLPYAYNTVSFSFPNDYSLISDSPLESQTLNIHVFSGRGIVGSTMLSHAPMLNTYSDSTADVFVELIDQPAALNFSYEYTLNPDELGLFSFSTYLPDTVELCDNLGRGYFAFIVEPDPNDSVIIQKVFTLIIDRSGSMGGDKMYQAREAANFIVDNLNTGDEFNLIDFDDEVTSLFADHVPVTGTNITLAHSYIDALTADGSTNISGSFEVAIPQFEDAEDDVANIIIFFTDGQPTAGITSTDGILNLIDDLVTDYDVVDISINCFGVGFDVNDALLSQIASAHNGIYESFVAGDLLAEISDFYLTIQNPVLLNTEMTFDPPVTYEMYPDPLPNLYLGHQLIVVGRYAIPGEVDVTFSGEKYGAIINYDYSFSLSDSSIEQNLFLPKLWAIEKMNDLMSEYYTYPLGSPEADSIEDIITTMSLCYSVVSPFTSFSDDNGGYSIGIEESSHVYPEGLKNFPNPFRQETHIRFKISSDAFRIIPCVILDLQGNIIRVLSLVTGPTGEYEFVWDGTDASGRDLHPGLYPYYIMIDGLRYNGVMEKL